MFAIERSRTLGRLAFAAAALAALPAGIALAGQQIPSDLAPASLTAGKRAWGPEQATGAPDTKGAGDISTAWASRMPDDRDEWLLLRYRNAVTPVAVVIHETYNPGAVNRVSAFRADGREVVIWKGQDPTRPDQERGLSNLPIRKGFRTDRLKVYVTSREIPGWNEIDAVGLVDASGVTQWAVSAQASSSYADRSVETWTTPEDRRIRQLQAEIRQLKARVKALEDALAAKRRRSAAR